MKYFFFFIALISFLNVKAQNVHGSDSAYYFIDTTYTSTNQRIWEIIDRRYVKYYEISCTCPQYAQSPAFAQNKNQQGKVLTADAFKKIHIIDLPSLIKVAKQFAEGKESNYTTIIFISKEEGLYKMYKVNVLQAKKSEVMY